MDTEGTPAHLCRRQASKRVLVSGFHAIYKHPQRPDILRFVSGNVALALEHSSRDFWGHVLEVIDVREFSLNLTAREQGDQFHPLLFFSCDKQATTVAVNMLYSDVTMCVLIAFEV